MIHSNEAFESVSACCVALGWFSDMMRKSSSSKVKPAATEAQTDQEAPNRDKSVTCLTYESVEPRVPGDDGLPEGGRPSAGTTISPVLFFSRRVNKKPRTRAAG